MLELISRRILRACGTLLMLLLIAFFLLEFGSGDPLQKFNDSKGVLKSAPEYQKIRRELEDKLGLNLPLFYFTIYSLAEPDTLFKVSLERDRKTLQRKLFKYGDWNQISNYYIAYNKLLTYNRNVNFDDGAFQLDCHEIITNHFHNETENDQLFRVKMLYSFYKAKKGVQLVDNLLAAEESITPKSHWTKYLPQLHFHSNNKFHRWVFGDGKYTKGIIKGDLGINYVADEPTEKKTQIKLFWTLLLSGLGIITMYVTGILSAIYTIGSKGDQN